MDGLHYITVGNPVSKAVISSAASIFNRKSNTVSPTPAVQAVKSSVQVMLPPLWKLAGRHYNFVRIAGLSGASAVILGAIGSHKLNNVQDKGETKLIFDTANRFHFFHSLALLGVPLAKYPTITGALMISGTLLFSGILYYRAFTGEKRLWGLAPVGGTCLIVAWLSLLV